VIQIIWYGTPENGGTCIDGLTKATEEILSSIFITLLPLIRHLEGDIKPYLNMEVKKQ